MGMREEGWQRRSIWEYYDLESIAFHQEVMAYALIDFLLHDNSRLSQLVLEAREQANIFACLSKEDMPYLMSAENVFDCSYDDHPAMIRYRELFRTDDQL